MRKKNLSFMPQAYTRLEACQDEWKAKVSNMKRLIAVVVFLLCCFGVVHAANERDATFYAGAYAHPNVPAPATGNPIPVVVTDANGNTLAVSGISGSSGGTKVGNPTPVVLTDANGNVLNLSSGGGIAPTASTIDASSSTYGMKWDTIQDQTCSIANTSPNISCTHTIFKGSMVGKRVFGFAGCNADNNLTQSPIIQGTVLTFTDTQHIVVDTNAIGTQAGTACIFVGTIDETGLAAVETAAAAAPQCPTILMPAGMAIVTKAHFIQALTTCNQLSIITGNSGIGAGQQVIGQGKGVTKLVMDPAFDQTTCTGGVASSACFGGQIGQNFQHFGITGGENNNANLFTVAHTLFEFGSYSLGNDLAFDGFGTNNANTQVFFNGIGDVGLTYVDFIGFSNTYVTALAGVYNVTHSSFQDTCGANILNVQAGAVWNSSKNLYADGVCAPNPQKLIRLAGTLNSDDDLYFGDLDPNLSRGISTEAANVIANIKNSKFNCPTASSFGIFEGSGLTYVTSQNNTFVTCTNGVSAQFGTFLDYGGSPTIKITGSNVYTAPGHSVSGICTGLATASSTLGLYGTGPNATTTTCTSTTVGSGVPVVGVAQTLENLVCTVGVAGTSSSTCTVLVDGSVSAITCTIAGAATSCSDSTHTVALTNGQRVSIEFISGIATTPTGVNAVVEWN